MRPETNKPWRKSLRKASRGLGRGRRTTHRVETQSPRPGSSWYRRHWWMQSEAS